MEIDNINENSRALNYLVNRHPIDQPVSMVIPEVVGFKLIGKFADGITAINLVLTVTNILRTKGVVGKFLEFYSDVLDYLSVSDKATIANIAPEYCATCGFFPTDQKTLDYLILTGRPEEQIKLVEVYAKEQGLGRSSDELAFFDMLEVDLSSAEPVMAGPKRLKDKVFLSQVAESFSTSFSIIESKESNVLQDGSIIIADYYNLLHHIKWTGKGLTFLMACQHYKRFSPFC